MLELVVKRVLEIQDFPEALDLEVQVILAVLETQEVLEFLEMAVLPAAVDMVEIQVFKDLVPDSAAPVVWGEEEEIPAPLLEHPGVPEVPKTQATRVIVMLVHLVVLVVLVL